MLHFGIRRLSSERHRSRGERIQLVSSSTPLIDFILDVEGMATGAQLASTAAFCLDASLARWSNHRRAHGGALSVRQRLRFAP